LPDPAVVEVASAVGLAEGTRGVETLLSALARLEPVSVRALGRAADLPVPIVAAVCGELRRLGHVSETRPVQFTLEGRRRFASGPAIDPTCPACGGRGIEIPPGPARLRRGLALVAELAPEPLVELDQCHCTPKTKVRRVLAMHASGAIGGRRILLLGDDDLIAVALLRFTRQYHTRIEELVVVDIDERVLAFLELELAGAPFPFRCVQHDVREPLALGRFDTVVTDPPYTALGARLFVTRAAESLRGEGSSVFLSFGSRRPGVQLELQRAILDSGLEIRSLTRDFNDYVGAGALGGTSHLYQLAVAVPADVGTELYTGIRSRTAATPSTSRRPATRSAARP
jgi:N4-bis(aminopropyl)spermidine synthase